MRVSLEMSPMDMVRRLEMHSSSSPAGGKRTKSRVAKRGYDTGPIAEGRLRVLPQHEGFQHPFAIGLASGFGCNTPHY